MPFDPAFQSKRKSRPYRIGRPAEKADEHPAQDYGPKLTAQEWRSLSHAQKLEYCRGDKLDMTKL